MSLRGIFRQTWLAFPRNCVIVEIFHPSLVCMCVYFVFEKVMRFIVFVPKESPTLFIRNVEGKFDFYSYFDWSYWKNNWISIVFETFTLYLLKIYCVRFNSVTENFNFCERNENIILNEFCILIYPFKNTCSYKTLIYYLQKF